MPYGFPLQGSGQLGNVILFCLLQLIGLALLPFGLLTALLRLKRSESLFKISSVSMVGRTYVKVFMKESAFNAAVAKRCRVLREAYRPVGWLFNGHVETIFAALFR